ncbi:MAG: phosphoethanolamine transferase [Bacteroidales bacterium]|nr:phosphoethanolamine transferase [Bacteroidales bacterium]
MSTLRQVFPTYLLIMIFYVQIISLALNYDIYDTREIAIYFCWIPIVTLPYYFIKKKIVYKIAVTIFFIDGLINLCHLLILKGPITASSLFVLLNTNINEAKEFMELKFSFLLLLLIPYIFLYFLCIRKIYSVITYPKSNWIIIIIILLSTIFLSENLVNERLIRKGIPQTAKALVSFGNELKYYNALKKRKVANIHAKFNSGELQQHVFVLIIGESCSRNHMSLYNYKRNTNPRLEKRKDIIVYKNVISPYSNTLNSVLSILTESNIENKMSFDKSISVIDVFHSLEFKTIWLSNQSPIGVWDNAVYNLANTSDISVFVNNNANTSFESTYLSSYDERLFQPFYLALDEKTKNKFIVIHLMGSHAAYAKRYPNKYNKFTNYSTNKERLINEYDNSVLYNDFVVDSILDILDSYSLKHDNIISSAIYLADHSENVFDENNNVGHDYSGALPKSNVEIPFIIWLSPKYIQFYNDKQKTILSNIDKPFMSDDLFHTILDLNDIECKEYIKKRSMFNKDYDFKRLRILEDNMNYDLK